MASRLMNYWRSAASRLGATRTVTTASVPRMQPYASTATAEFTEQSHRGSKSKGVEGDLVPVYVLMGFVLLSLSLGAHTAKHQLANAPNVRVSKKKRETVPEVEDPDRVASEADRFVKKSLFRKVGHIQDFDAVRAGVGDPTRPNPFTHPRHVETLKSVGVDLSAH